MMPAENKLILEVQTYCQDLIDSFREAFAANTLRNIESGVASFHTYKATRILEAILLLAKSPYHSEAYTLFRTLLNLCINLRWMFQAKSAYRTQRYSDFDVVNKQKGITNLLRTAAPTEKSRMIKKARENKLKIEELKKKYQLPNDYDLNSWSGKSISDMASETGIAWYYDLVYTHLSNHEHTNPSSVHKYFEKVSDGKLVLRKTNQDKEKLELLIRTLHVYLLVVDAYNGQTESKVAYDRNIFKALEARALKKV